MISVRRSAISFCNFGGIRLLGTKLRCGSGLVGEFAQRIDCWDGWLELRQLAVRNRRGLPIKVFPGICLYIASPPDAPHLASSLHSVQYVTEALSISFGRVAGVKSRLLVGRASLSVMTRPPLDTIRANSALADRGCNFERRQDDASGGGWRIEAKEGQERKYVRDYRKPRALKCGLTDRRGGDPAWRLSGSVGSGAALVEDTSVSFSSMMYLHGELPRRMHNIWLRKVMRSNI
jgi:hypothetical protein